MLSVIGEPDIIGPGGWPWATIVCCWKWYSIETIDFFTAKTIDPKTKAKYVATLDD
jgi:hypothetical protein